LQSRCIQCSITTSSCISKRQSSYMCDWTDAFFIHTERCLLPKAFWIFCYFSCSLDMLFLVLTSVHSSMTVNIFSVIFMFSVTVGLIFIQLLFIRFPNRHVYHIRILLNSFWTRINWIWLPYFITGWSELHSKKSCGVLYVLNTLYYHC
jgi:hypothetical protein